MEKKRKRARLTKALRNILMNGESEKTEILSVKHLFVEGTIYQGNKRLFEISALTSDDIHKQSISYPLRPCKLETTKW